MVIVIAVGVPELRFTTVQSTVLVPVNTCQNVSWCHGTYRCTLRQPKFLMSGVLVYRILLYILYGMYN